MALTSLVFYLKGAYAKRIGKPRIEVEFERARSENEDTKNPGEDDTDYWDRFLQTAGDISSMPSAAPSPLPTRPDCVIEVRRSILYFSEGNFNT